MDRGNWGLARSDKGKNCLQARLGWDTGLSQKPALLGHGGGGRAGQSVRGFTEAVCSGLDLAGSGWRVQWPSCHWVASPPRKPTPP